MNINIQNKSIRIDSKNDFEEIMEKMFYALKIEEGMQSKKKKEFTSFESAFAKYGL